MFMYVASEQSCDGIIINPHYVVALMNPGVFAPIMYLDCVVLYQYSFAISGSTLGGFTLDV